MWLADEVACLCPLLPVALHCCDCARSFTPRRQSSNGETFCDPFVSLEEDVDVLGLQAKSFLLLAQSCYYLWHQRQSAEKVWTKLALQPWFLW